MTAPFSFFLGEASYRFLPPFFLPLAAFFAIVSCPSLRVVLPFAGLPLQRGIAAYRHAHAAPAAPSLRREHLTPVACVRHLFKTKSQKQKRCAHRGAAPYVEWESERRVESVTLTHG